MTYDEMVRQLNVNVQPVKDENPFFYKFSEGLQMEMIPLIGLVVFSGFFLWKKGKENGASKARTAYFSVIGIGYILIELGFIQSMQRYLEKPIYSFTIVLLGMLVGSAFGALLSGRIEVIRKMRKHAPLTISLLSIFGYHWMGRLMAQTYMLSISEKVLLTLPVLLVIGFFMGIPFPYGIESMHKNKKEEKDIPLMYAYNGTASILGSVIAMLVAIEYGFGVVVLSGAILYAGLGVYLNLSKS